VILFLDGAFSDQHISSQEAIVPTPITSLEEPADVSATADDSTHTVAPVNEVDTMVSSAIHQTL